jgi:predicted Zn-dependent peptidase
MSVALMCALLLGASARSAPEAQMRVPAYTTNKLDNGITLLLMERHELPLVSFVWIMRSGGSRFDPEGQEGTAALTAQMLRKGTRTRSAEEISQTLDFAGASFGASAVHDYSAGSAGFLAKDIDLAVELLTDLLMNPVFPGDEVEKMIKQEVDGIAEEKEVPNQVIGRYFRRALFSGHPYSRPPSGTETSLPRITADDLKKFHGANYDPDQLILSVVGDFKSNEIRTKLAAAFAKWPTGPHSGIALRSPEAVKGRRVLLVEKPDATQTFFRMGNIGLPRTSPDWVPLEVVNTLFGGRFTSMLNTSLRIESGLTYGARSGFSANPVPGEFAISSFTKNETTSQALDLALATLKKLHQTGFTTEQLDSAKSYIKGQFGPSLETNDQLAHEIAELEFFGLGADEIRTFFDRVEAVTPDQARALIEKYYPSEYLLFVFIGQKQVIRPVGKALEGH